jgi:hypothetical protein
MQGPHSHSQQLCRRPELDSSGAGSFHMRNSDDYHRFAEECERLAQEAKAEHHRTVLREMAATWRMLAEEAARKRKDV